MGTKIMCILRISRSYFWRNFQLKFENFSKTLLFCQFIIFKRAQCTRTSISSNYIYFMKTTNEWIAGNTIGRFGDLEIF